MVVHLERATEDPVRYYDGYEAVPRPDGSFSFTEIPHGDYTITVDDESQLSMAPPGAIFPSDMPSGTAVDSFAIGFPFTVWFCGTVRISYLRS
jgi:hypothetical protein